MMTADRLRTVPGSLAGWLARSLGVANDRANAYCARREHESGFLRVEDAYGLAAKCPGMALGLELRMVAGKRVGGLPQTMLKSVLQTAASPVEMVFIVPDGTYVHVRYRRRRSSPLRYGLSLLPLLYYCHATYPPRCRSLRYTSQCLFLPVESDLLCCPNPLFPCFPASYTARCPSPDVCLPSPPGPGFISILYSSVCRSCYTCSSTCIA